MTNIGKIHGAQHINPKEQPKAEEKCTCEECIEEETPKAEINLDNDPHSSIGRSMVRTIKNDKGVTLAADYNYDLKSIEEDARDFHIVTEVAKEYAQDLVDRGYDPYAAADKAAQFAQSLLSQRNK